MEVYVAKWQDDIGASCECTFAHLAPAMFFVITGLIHCVDWNKFPDLRRRYPADDRNGSDQRLNPIFRITATARNGRQVCGQVLKMQAAESWFVGNGIAQMAGNAFAKITGAHAIFSGVGDNYHARVGRERRHQMANPSFTITVTDAQKAALTLALEKAGINPEGGTLPSQDGVQLSFTVSGDVITFEVLSRPFWAPLSLIKMKTQDFINQESNVG